MNLRCHFDSSGWLQGPISITHLLTPNHGTGFGTGRGVVLHTEDGFEAGTVATFMNAANQVSAFFSVGVDGAVHQYVPVGQGLTAWSQMAGNESFRGVETEDKTTPSTPLTQAQITAVAQILEACSAYDGFPLQITDSPSGTGLILHSDGGAAWGNHPSCPGSVRAAQRPQIIALAMAIRSGGNPPKPQPKPAPKGWTAAMLADLPELAEGASDAHQPHWYVRRAQIIANGIFAASPALTVDGSFGPATGNALSVIQRDFKLPVTGKLDAATWALLLAAIAP